MTLTKKQLKNQIKIENKEIEIEVQSIKESNIFDLLYDTCKVMGDYSLVFWLNELSEEYEDFKKRKIKELEQRLVK
jgi:hypothetical protein